MPDAPEPLAATPGTPDDEPDFAHADIGLVYATPLEMSPFLDRCTRVRKYVGQEFVFRGARFDQVKTAFVQCGMGFAAARRATQALIDAHSPPWIISTGFSGALVPEMQVGDIVMAHAVADTHGQELKLDLQLQSNPASRLHVGKLLTVDGIVRTVAEKKLLAEQHQAIAIDMESLAVAQVCRETRTRFLAVRVISDDLSADLPPEILSVVGSSGSLRVGAALGALWKRPGSFKDLWHLRESANSAADRLATFLEGVIVQLYDALH